MPRSTHRKTYTSRQVEVCSGCRQDIPVGTSFWRGTTKEPWHPSCKRMGVNVNKPAYKRYLTDDPVGQDCGGCGMVIHLDDQVVHKSAVPWHRECSLVR
jgi:hypothetical protein